MSARTPPVAWLRAFVWLVVLGAGAYVYAAHVWDAPAEAFAWRFGAAEYQLLEPRLLVVGLALPAIFFMVSRSLTDMPWPQRVLGAAFRAGFIVLLGLSLARLVTTQETHRSATVFLVDVSDSATDVAIDEWRGAVGDVLERLSDDDWAELVVFGGKARRVALTGADALSEAGTFAAISKRALPPTNELRALLTADERSTTNPSAALQLAAARLPSGYNRRVVLLTDGRETEGDLLSEVSDLLAQGIRVDTLSTQQPPPQDAAVVALETPNKIQIGKPFRVRAKVFSTRPSTVLARLYQNDLLNGLDSVRQVELEPGENELEFRSVVRVGGEVNYRLEIEPVDQDRFATNNRFSTTVKVPGQPRVLVVDGQSSPSNHFVRALLAQQYDVDARPPTAFPTSLGELGQFDFVVVSDVPRSALGLSAQRLIERYVKDLGGGFLFIGGASGWALGGWEGSPLERLLPLRTESTDRQEQPGVAMSLVIDRSGSMSGKPIDMAKAACQAAVAVLRPDDQIEIIAFDATPRRAVRMQPVRYRRRIDEEIRRIRAGGGTNIFPALDMAFQDISVVAARRKHVILLTDGRSPTRGLEDLVRAMTADGITLTTVGLGSGVDAEILRSMAEAGGGVYHAVPDASRLPRIFTRETERVAQSAAVDEWFPVVQNSSADFLRGISLSSAPLLRGHVSTRFIGAPAQQVLSTDSGTPLLARQRRGLGWVLAWTSDVKPRWGRDWLRWRGFGKFWGQLVREHLRSADHRLLPMTVELGGDVAKVSVDALTLQERFDNGLVSTLRVVGPAPKRLEREVALTQTGPGRYTAEFELDELGTHRLEATHNRPGKEGELIAVARSFGQVTRPYPLEYAEFTPDVARLQQAALLGEGLYGANAEELVETKRAVVTREPLWQSLVIAAIVLFLLDVLLRRVRIFRRSPSSRRAGVDEGALARSPDH